MPHKFNHARRHKIEKAKYRLRNRPSYDAVLRRSGDVRLWIFEEATAGWCARPGRWVYGAPAVETCLTLRVVFGFRCRNSIGLP